MGRTGEERAAILTAESERLAALLVKRGAVLVVVFGSVARGTVAPTSDLDMIAVIESDLPFIARLERLYHELQPNVGLDLLVYTPREFEEMRVRSFVRQALTEGKVLHAA